jgi:hypothetical protein
LNVNNLSITSTGSVTDLGDIDIDGTLVVSAAGQAIDLSGTGNDLTGAVTLTGAAVTLADTTATSIAGITATGALSVTSGRSDHAEWSDRCGLDGKFYSWFECDYPE